MISSVLDIQALVGRRAIHADTALHLIATRSHKLCGAAGTAIALLDGENLEYKAATGIAERLLGARILADTSFSFRQLAFGEVVQSDTWKDKALSTRVVAKSVLSAPIHQNGKLAGCIQFFSRMGRFAEESIYACELMSTIAARLVEDPEFSFNPDRNGDVDPKTVMEISPERTLGAAPTLETNDDSTRWQTISSKERLRWPPSETKVRRDSVTRHAEAKLTDLPAEFENFSGTPNDEKKEQKPAAKNEHTTLFNSGTLHLPMQKAGLGINGNPQDSSCRLSKSSDRRARVTAMLYPALVLLFVAMANMLGERRTWLLDLATVIIVYFTAVEVWKRLVEP